MSTCNWEWYAQSVSAAGVREECHVARKIPEIEIQTRWHAGEFGVEWLTLDGVKLRIIDYGEWNRESGPDFTGATIELSDGGILRGDIEIDTHARDWERHGHVTNPAFDRTILHVCTHFPEGRFFTRTRENRMVHQVRLEVPEKPKKSTLIQAPLDICHTKVAAIYLLRSAARYRLHQKSITLSRAAETCGQNAAWYRALAVALGYKRNKLPFLLLAERCDPDLASAPHGEAFLFGLAGFLNDTEPALVAPDVKDYLQSLWKSWWSLRSTCERLVISRDLWTFGGSRPVNHPHRRVAALAMMAKHWHPIFTALKTGDRNTFATTLQQLEHPFWSLHFNLHAAPLKSPQSLIGSQRVQDMITNIFYPIMLSGQKDVWEQFLNEPGTTVGKSHWMMASRFFPNVEIDQKLLKSAVHQQGLLQLEADFLTAPNPDMFRNNIRQHLKVMPT